jgi:3-mercaptopyruvate sulfurtransferase SseA
MHNARREAGKIAIRFLIAIGAGLIAGHAFAEEAKIYQAIVGDPNGNAPEISTEQMRKILSDGSVIVVDARPRQEFVNGHIPKAVEPAGSSPVTAVLQLVGGDKSKELVLYCNGPFCQASR